jgi:hypothetical protein
LGHGRTLRIQAFGGQVHTAGHWTITDSVKTNCNANNSGFVNLLWSCRQGYDGGVKIGDANMDMMKIEMRGGCIDLQPAGIFRMSGASGAVIRCESGVLWVTQENRPRDDFLCAGQSLSVISAGVTVVEAVGELAARIRLCAPAKPTVNPLLQLRTVF